MIGETSPSEPAGADAPAATGAVVALLIASARSDGTVSPHEANQIEHVASGMKLFRHSTLQTRHALFTATADRIKEQGIGRVIRDAVAVIPKELAATTFALAVDLMLSDGRLTASEQRFADDLRGMLCVDREMAARIVDVLAIKNAG
jgi:hypothetical protein